MSTRRDAKPGRFVQALLGLRWGFSFSTMKHEDMQHGKEAMRGAGGVCERLSSGEVQDDGITRWDGGNETGRACGWVVEDFWGRRERSRWLDAIT